MGVLLLGFGDVVAERGTSSEGRVEDVGVMRLCDGRRRGGSRGEAIVDMVSIAVQWGRNNFWKSLAGQ